MKGLIQLIRQHPISFISYLLYGLLWYVLLNEKHRYKVEIMDDGNRLAFGEGVAYTALFIIFIGIIFILIALLNAAFRKGQRLFYLLLSLPIAVSILFLIFVLGI